MNDTYAPGIVTRPTKLPFRSGDVIKHGDLEVYVVKTEKRVHHHHTVVYCNTSNMAFCHRKLLSEFTKMMGVAEDEAVYYINRKPSERIVGRKLMMQVV
jgi:hypothetical protein